MYILGKCTSDKIYIIQIYIYVYISNIYETNIYIYIYQENVDQTIDRVPDNHVSHIDIYIYIHYTNVCQTNVYHIYAYICIC